MTAAEVLKKLKNLGCAENVAGMERFGIISTYSFGITAPVLKQFAREVKNQAADRHLLALELWETGNYEARAVAFLIDDRKRVTPEQMENGPPISTTGRRLMARARIFSAALHTPMKKRSSGASGRRNL